MGLTGICRRAEKMFPVLLLVCRKYLRLKACRQQGLDPASRGNLHAAAGEGRKGVAAIGGF